MNKIPPYVWVALTLAVSILFLFPSGAQAQSITVEDNIGRIFLPIDDALNVARFDPALGILTSVEISATSDITGTFAYENPLPTPTTLEGVVEGTLAMELPTGQTLAITGNMLSVVEALSGFGTGEEAFEYRVSVGGEYTADAMLTAFTGVGMVSIPTLVYAQWDATGINSNVDIRLRTTGDAQVRVIYNYAIPQIELQKRTNDTDADRASQADVPQVAAGDLVNWTYFVENTGAIAVPQALVTLVDSDPAVTPVFDPASDDGGDGVLSPGETWRYAASGPALNLEDGAATAQSTIVAGCDEDGAGLYGTRKTYQNVATLSAPGVEVSDPSHYCNPAAPAVSIETSTNGIDADDADDPNAPQILPGATANWVYVVRNDGNVSFTVAQVVVTDSHPDVVPVFDPSSDDGDGILSPGESWTFTASGSAPNLILDEAGQDNTIVPGCSTAGAPVAYENVGRVVVPGAEDTDPTHYCNPVFPAIDIETSTNGVDVDDPDDPTVPVLLPGETVTWGYVVRNDGNVSFTLDEVDVTDSQPGVTPVFDPSSDDGDGILSPGESWRYNAAGGALDLEDIEATAESTIVPGCSPSGRRHTYENVGSVVVPGDDDADPTHYCNPANPAIDIETSTNGADADDADDVTVPVLDVDASANWVYVVRNEGNVAFTLAEVIVTDSHPDVTPVFDPSSDDGDGLLSPGETWRYSAVRPALDLDDADAVQEGTVVLGCTASGMRNTYENVGRVAVPGDDDEDPTHYCNPAAPAIDIEKSTNGADADDPQGSDVPTVVPGAPVAWSYTVTNLGNVTYPQADVTVTDSDETLTLEWLAESDAGSDQLLSPGESWRYRASATALDLLDPSVSSLATVVDGCDAFGTGTRPTYLNVATVTVPDTADNDPSHYCNLTPTAVELVSLRARAVNGAVDVTWRYSAASDSFGFRVLRSTTPDFAAATSITTKMSLNEQDAGDGVKTFTVTDHAVPANRLHYYWLVLITVSGREVVHGPTAAIVYDQAEGYLMFLPLLSTR